MRPNSPFASCLWMLVFLAAWPLSRASAYESGIHYYLTYLSAYECGLHADAARIALADFSVDRFPDTDAGSHFDEWLDFSKESTRRIFHFPIHANSNEKVIRGSDVAWETVHFAIEEASASNVNTLMLGIGLHTLQDSYSHEGFGPLLGHWTQAPDLPETDPQKMIEGAEATWIALNEWSEKVYGQSCEISFADWEPSLESWVKLPLSSDPEILKAWQGIAASVTHAEYEPYLLYTESAFQKEFEVAAGHVRKLKGP